MAVSFSYEREVDMNLLDRINESLILAQWQTYGGWDVKGLATIFIVICICVGIAGVVYNNSPFMKELVGKIPGWFWSIIGLGLLGLVALYVIRGCL